MTWPLHALMLPLWFVTGTMAGSFANVAIYRLPWQKSILWPPSTCPKCLAPIAPRDNVPIVGWLALGKACRSCRAPIAARYAWVELIVGLLFVALYATDVMAEPRLIYGETVIQAMGRLVYHAILATLVVIATFIDYDLQIIPDSVTVPGMLLGLGLGAAYPHLRMEPAEAATWLGGLGVGLLGLIVGAAVIYGVRAFAFVLFRKEGMGLGDVTLVAMIGAFLGWQVVPLTLFLGAMLGLIHAVARVFLIVRDRWAGRRPPDTAIPFGPYLSMAAFLLLVGWRWIWPAWAGPLYKTYGEMGSLLWRAYGPG